jgi:D-amino-acid dehydrogenase
MARVVVIGAGVVGLASAYELRRGGADVTVLDMGQPGAACSAGNAGWIVPVISTPLPAPGLVATSLKWMLKPDSPLYIKPRVDPGFNRWLWRFWRNCRPAQFQAGLDALGRLNRRTMPLFDALVDDGVRFEMHRAGLLFVSFDRTMLEHAADEVGHLTGFGYAHPPLLSASDVRELEPGLSSAVAGGFFIEQERHVRPETLSAGLVAWLEERGVEILPGVEAIGLERRGRAITAVTTRDGSLAADQVLVAAGAWTGRLAAKLGIALPIEAGKGYSITYTAPERQLNHPLDLVEARVAVTPFDGGLRLAGTMELSGLNLRLEPTRVEAIRRSGERFLGAWSRGNEERVWVGMRPLTPDGLPVIGRLPVAENLYVNSGHQMLGVTLAPATGQVIAQYMLTGTSDIDLTPFDPARFGGQVA